MPHTGDGWVEQVFCVGILMCSVLRVQNLLLRLRDWEKKGRESLSRSDMIGQSRLMSTW